MQAIVTYVTVFAPTPQTEAAHELRLAALHAGQSKLHILPALTAFGDQKPQFRDIGESLAVVLQLVVESAQRLAVSR